MSGRGWIWGWGRKGNLAKMKEAEGREKQPASCRKPDLEGSVFTAPHEVRTCTQPCHLVKRLLFVICSFFFFLNCESPGTIKGAEPGQLWTWCVSVCVPVRLASFWPPTPTFYKGQLGCKVKVVGDPLVLWDYFTKQKDQRS